jgi:hypothetical protein
MKRVLGGIALAGLLAAFALGTVPGTALAQAPARICPGGEPERTVTAEQRSIMLNPVQTIFTGVFVPGVIAPTFPLGVFTPTIFYNTQVVVETVTTTYNYKGVTGVTFIVRQNSLLGRQEILSTPAWLRQAMGEDETAIRRALDSGTLKNSGPCS